MRLRTTMQRVEAYFHLGRLEEAVALVDGLKFALDAKPTVIFWKARLCERLGRHGEAEDLYRQCNQMSEDTAFMLAYAAFLVARERPEDAVVWIDRVLAITPRDRDALTLRTDLAARNRRAGLPPAPRREPLYRKLWRRLAKA